MISYHANTTDDNMYEQEEKDMVSDCVKTIQQDKESKADEKVTSLCGETMSWTHDDKNMYEQEEKYMVSDCLEKIQQDNNSKADEKSHKLVRVDNELD